MSNTTKNELVLKLSGIKGRARGYRYAIRYFIGGVQVDHLHFYFISQMAKEVSRVRQGCHADAGCLRVVWESAEISGLVTGCVNTPKIGV
jgi:hypothetical protein